MTNISYLSYNINIMGKKQTVVMPQVQNILSKMGNQIKLARLRRKLSAQVVSERAGISRATLWQIENGSASVSMGSYAAVLTALALQNDLLLVAKDDVLGRTYQDMNLKVRKRSPKKTDSENKGNTVDIAPKLEREEESFDIIKYLEEYDDEIGEK